MVEAELRDVHVSILASACDKTEGAEETLSDPLTKEQYVVPPEYTIGRTPLLLMMMLQRSSASPRT